MSSPSSSNVLIGRGIILFAPRVSGVLQGYRDLGNCDVFSITPAVEFSTLKNFRNGVGADYKKVAKGTSLDVKVAGYEFDPSIISMMLFGSESALAQGSGTVTGTSETLVGATVTGVKGTSFQTAKRKISTVVLTQGANTLVAGTDYDVTDAVAGVIRILPTGSTVVDGTAITVTYAYAADTSAVISPASVTSVSGRMVFIPDVTTGPELEHIYWDAAMSPDGEMNFISEEWAKWGATVSLNDDSAGLYGGSSTYPYGKIIARS
jgi:hypothetical protein